MRHVHPKRTAVVLLLLVLSLHFSPRVHAASPFEEVPLSDALDRLAAARGVAIVYSTDTVHAGMRVAPPEGGAEIEPTLDAWLSRWNLAFERIHDVIVIRHAQRPLASGMIVGRVHHGMSGVPLSGISVQTGDGSIRAVSAHDGSFLLQPVGPGEHVVTIASRGWENLGDNVTNIDASGIGFVQLDLVESVYSLDNIVVSPSFYALDADRVTVQAHLGSRDIEAAPKLGGEILRSVGYLPGVMQDGASARSHLRGGAADETLYLFDGVRLYDPFHLRDFLAPFSFLDPQRVASVNVRVGAFPVSYGNRLSGVIAFDPVEAYARFGGEAELNVFSTGVLLSDSVGNGATAWVASARRGHLDLLVNAFDLDTGSPSYFDAYMRVEHETAHGVRLSASFLGARDRLVINSPDDEQAARADYDDQYAWLRATWSPAADVDVTTTLSLTRLHGQRTGAVNDPDEFSGAVFDYRDIDIHNASADIAWRVTPRLRIRAGAGVEERAADFDYRASRRVLGPLGAFGDNGDFDRTFRESFTGDAQHAYVELRSRFNDGVHGDIGLRVDRQGYPDGWHTNSGPRLGIAWQVNDTNTLRASAGRYWQAMGIEELPVEDGVDRYFTPQRADNLVLGWDSRLRPDLLFRAELFAKHVGNPWQRSENLLNPMSLVPELEPDRITLVPQSAHVRGVEMSLVREHGSDDFSYWLIASAARATDRIDGRDIARSWDQPWRLEAGARWHWAGWMLQAVARASAGLPATPLVLESAAGPPVVRTGEINSERLSFGNSLDLRASREWRVGDDRYTFYAEVINVYNGSADCCVEYTLAERNGQYSLQRDVDQWYGVVPNVGFHWRF